MKVTPVPPLMMECANTPDAVALPDDMAACLAWLWLGKLGHARGPCPDAPSTQTLMAWDWLAFPEKNYASHHILGPTLGDLGAAALVHHARGKRWAMLDVWLSSKPEIEGRLRALAGQSNYSTTVAGWYHNAETGVLRFAGNMVDGCTAQELASYLACRAGVRAPAFPSAGDVTDVVISAEAKPSPGAPASKVYEAASVTISKDGVPLDTGLSAGKTSAVMASAPRKLRTPREPPKLVFRGQVHVVPRAVRAFVAWQLDGCKEGHRPAGPMPAGWNVIGAGSATTVTCDGVAVDPAELIKALTRWRQFDELCDALDEAIPTTPGLLAQLRSWAGTARAHGDDVELGRGCTWRRSRDTIFDGAGQRYTASAVDLREYLDRHAAAVRAAGFGFNELGAYQTEPRYGLALSASLRTWTDAPDEVLCAALWMLAEGDRDRGPRPFWVTAPWGLEFHSDKPHRVSIEHSFDERWSVTESELLAETERRVQAGKWTLRAANASGRAALEDVIDDLDLEIPGPGTRLDDVVKKLYVAGQGTRFVLEQLATHQRAIHRRLEEIAATKHAGATAMNDKAATESRKNQLTLATLPAAVLAFCRWATDPDRRAEDRPDLADAWTVTVGEEFDRFLSARRIVVEVTDPAGRWSQWTNSPVLISKDYPRKADREGSLTIGTASATPVTIGENTPMTKPAEVAVRDTEQPILKTLKTDATEAAWRTAGSQFVKLAREPLVGLLARHIGPDDTALRGKLAAFLETEIGTALLASLLSVGLGAMPGVAGEVPQRLSRELRVRAMSDASDVVADVLMGPLRQVMMMYLKDLPAVVDVPAEPPALKEPTGVRADATPEPPRATDPAATTAPERRAPPPDRRARP